MNEPHQEENRTHDLAAAGAEAGRLRATVEGVVRSMKRPGWVASEVLATLSDALSADVAEQVELSSLGTPEAVAARASVSDERAAEVVALSHRMAERSRHALEAAGGEEG